MASEKESLSTGDQSLSEAISAGKYFYYETLSHKVSVLKDLIKLAKDTDFHFADLYSEVYMPGNSGYPFIINSSKLADLFYRARTDQKVANAWKMMNDYIFDECAFGMRFHQELCNIVPAK